MDFIEYIKNVPRHAESNPEDFPARTKINLITNFTDDILQKLLIGVGMHHGIHPTIQAMPYKQYHVQLKNPESAMYAHRPDITFIFFSMNPLRPSEFASPEHFNEILANLETYARKISGTVLVAAFPVSYYSAYGNLFAESPHFKSIEGYNERLHALAKALPNAIWFDTNRLVHLLGELHTFDPRAMYAFDLPFTNEFMTLLAEEWFAHIRAMLGTSKKAIIVDLDNTLWGGVVGELGPMGIALGPDYPGNAFVNFQRALLDFYERGIILAINSKNNPEDVAEVFEKNPHMILKEKHFAAIRTNWDDKTENLIAIAKDLNIGTDSIVFLDDDPVHRHAVKNRLPEITVPDFSLPPEEYAKTLYRLDWFHQLSLTDEDRKKGVMYAEERQRKTLASNAKDMEQYIAELNIVIDISINREDAIPRLSQLTLKTNQYNVTTKRYTESDIHRLIKEGALLFSATVSDRFGDYGLTILAIVTPGSDQHDVLLDSFLMSCRVMGRGVECAFIDAVVRELARRGKRIFHASFIPTAKNEPAKSFLPDHGFIPADTTISEPEHNAPTHYLLDIPSYLEHPCEKVNKGITIMLKN